MGSGLDGSVVGPGHRAAGLVELGVETARSGVFDDALGRIGDTVEALIDRRLVEGDLHGAHRAAAAEIVGTIAVVISLLFVGYSINRNTDATQASSENILFERHTDSGWLPARHCK